ncbi:MAG: hypothetical protein QM813_02585 [Verrucomicrobiota bacterium]
MKVNSNRNLPAVSSVTRPNKRAAATATAPETDFQASAKLALKLAATPTTRTEQVARAKALIADPNYPNTKTISQVADRLAGRIKSTVTEE